jgi:hypothetical protein
MDEGREAGGSFAHSPGNPEDENDDEDEDDFEGHARGES